MVESKKIKVKAGGEFHHYRNKVLGLPVKDFRALQDGKTLLVDRSIYDNHPKAFEEVKGEIKNGN